MHRNWLSGPGLCWNAGCLCDIVYPTRARTELGQRRFPVAATTVWNSLPAHLRSTLINCRQFRDGLKSHLFVDAYLW